VWVDVFLFYCEYLVGCDCDGLDFFVGIGVFVDFVFGEGCVV